MYGRMSSVLGCLEIRLASDHEGGEYIEDDFLDGRPKSVQRLAKKILRITKARSQIVENVLQWQGTLLEKSKYRYHIEDNIQTISTRNIASAEKPCRKNIITTIEWKKGTYHRRHSSTSILDHN